MAVIEVQPAIEMCEIERFQPSDFLAAAQHCVDTGVSMVPGLLSHQSLRNLRGIIQPAVPRYPQAECELSIRQAAPELDGIMNLIFTPENVARGMKLTISTNSLEPPFQNYANAHQDNVSAPTGISVLLPVFGPEAVFATSTIRQFELSSLLFRYPRMHNKPEYISTYRMRDAILIRQAIDTCNGEPIRSKQTWHAGGAHKKRTILLVDFLARDITLPSTTVGSTDLAA